MLAQLGLIRILTDSIGTAQYSVFAVLSSLVNWMALSDVGLGSSLQNYISEQRAAGHETADYELTAMLLSLACAVAAAVLIFAVAPALSSLLLGRFVFIGEAQQLLSFSAMVYPAIGTAFGGIVYRIWFAEHRGYLSNVLPAIGTVIGVLAVWSVARLSDAPQVSGMIAAYYLPLAVVPLVALAIRARAVRWRGRFRVGLVRPLMSRAMQFWLVGIAAAFVLQIDYIVLARTLSSTDIVIYNVASKVFALILFVYSALLMALWPVFAEKLAAGDFRSVSIMLRRYVSFGLLFIVICGCGFYLTRNLLITILAPRTALDIPLSVIILLTLYCIVRVWTDTFSMVLYSLNDLKLFWIAVPIQAVLSFALQIAGALTFGLSGLIAGLILCFVLSVAWILPLRIRYLVRRAA